MTDTLNPEKIYEIETKILPPHTDGEGGEHAGLIVNWPTTAFVVAAVRVKVCGNLVSVSLQGKEPSDVLHIGFSPATLTEYKR